MQNWFKYSSGANLLGLNLLGSKARLLGQSASNSLVMGLGSKLRSLSITIALALIMYVTIGLTPAASAIAAPITFTPPMPIAVISTTKVTLHDNPTVPGEVKDRFSKIVNTMQKMRFCNRESCFYRGLESNIQATQSEQEPYAATIHAEIDRPASFFDYADYHFAYVGDRWRLMGAEEYTDVADYVFKGDKYEIFSVHASRILRGNIEDALNRTSSLKSGYVPLYYSVLRYGVERD